MKSYYSIIFILTLTAFIYPQDNLLKIEEVPFHYSLVNNYKIQLTQNAINISKESRTVFHEESKGKKEFKASFSKEFFYVANYSFPEDKSNYQINVNVFDKEAALVFTYAAAAYFDMPHPIFSINDNGVLASFDPISFKVLIKDAAKERELLLIDDPEFEMEKASFIEMTDKDIYILTSLKALTMEEEETNTALYKIDLTNLNVDEKQIDYSIPLLMVLAEEGLIISGIKFSNSIPTGSSIKMDYELNTLNVNNIAAEKIITLDNFYYCKFGNIIYKLDKDLTQSSPDWIGIEIESGERIVGLTSFNNGLAVVTNDQKDYYIYKLTADFNIDFKRSLDIFDRDKIEGIRFSNGMLLIYLTNYTLIYQ